MGWHEHERQNRNMHFQGDNERFCVCWHTQQNISPAGHRFMQDNDPKHTSRLGKRFLADNHITWWKTPPESPDLNPIENMWHELKEFLRWEIKPRTKDELVSGIQQFWGSVSGEKCRKYIRHLNKVIPRVMELGGAATGYWQYRVQSHKYTILYFTATLHVCYLCMPYLKILCWHFRHAITIFSADYVLVSFPPKSRHSLQIQEDTIIV